jgi:hypothetical protein
MRMGRLGKFCARAVVAGTTAIAIVSNLTLPNITAPRVLGAIAATRNGRAKVLDFDGVAARKSITLDVRILD